MAFTANALTPTPVAIALDINSLNHKYVFIEIFLALETKCYLLFLPLYLNTINVAAGSFVFPSLFFLFVYLHAWHCHTFVAHVQYLLKKFVTIQPLLWDAIMNESHYVSYRLELRQIATEKRVNTCFLHHRLIAARFFEVKWCRSVFALEYISKSR